MVDAFSEGAESIEAEEEWERGETVKQVKKSKKKDEPMSPVAVVRESPSALYTALSHLASPCLYFILTEHTGCDSNLR